jgi:hypothetical protein
MGYRRFNDTEGNEWEVRDVSRSQWEIQPVGDNPNRSKTVPAPGYEKDPFELSEEELQRLLGDTSGPGRSQPSKSPFKD